MATRRANVHSAAAPPPEAGGQCAPGEAAVAALRCDDIPGEEIAAQLQRILASPSFRNSKRNTEFLRFVVEKALAGSTAEIKERLIGVEVFERPHDYDVTTDPIVRGAAVELRRRIAQYYVEPDHAGELRVELPLGSYVPFFHWPTGVHKERQELGVVETAPSGAKSESAVAAHAEPAHTADAEPRRPGWIPLMVAGCALALALIGVVFATHYFRTQSAQRALDAFWAPVMNGGEEITVCVGDLNFFFKTPPISNVLQLHPNPTADNVLNPNAGAALLRVGSLLGARGKRATLRLADLTDLNDLRQQPVIFIGGMNNPWTQRILAGMRFQLKSTPNKPYGTDGILVDEKNPAAATWAVNMEAPLSAITEDYSLVTRMNDPLTGQPVVILCGLGPYGTAAASEFVSSSDYFSQFVAQAPRGWQDRNLQIVLETRVVNGRVSVPRVVAEQIY
ncbi:MAG TPA: hypothetical protein VMW15_10025 [Terracidiphilus sp.]|nr:hypothetical protein [Terracidiphilus sp.]